MHKFLMLQYITNSLFQIQIVYLIHIHVRFMFVKFYIFLNLSHTISSGQKNRNTSYMLASQTLSYRKNHPHHDQVHAIIMSHFLFVWKKKSMVVCEKWTFALSSPIGLELRRKCFLRMPSNAINQSANAIILFPKKLTSSTLWKVKDVKTRGQIY
jgi:hypothetical protein